MNLRFWFDATVLFFEGTEVADTESNVNLNRHSYKTRMHLYVKILVIKGVVYYTDEVPSRNEMASMVERMIIYALCSLLTSMQTKKNNYSLVPKPSTCGLD